MEKVNINYAKNQIYATNALFEFSKSIYVDEISVGVMEKYAILIGGGDTSASKNYDAFENDLFEMYDKLKQYDDWKDENIYCYLWDKTNAYNWRIDGMATNANIKHGLKSIGSNITDDVGVFLYSDYYDSGGNDYIYFVDLGQWLDDYIGNTWARSLFVFASCYSGHAIPEIHESSTKERAIVISATREDEEAKGWLVGGFIM